MRDGRKVGGTGRRIAGADPWRAARAVRGSHVVRIAVASVVSLAMVLASPGGVPFALAQGAALNDARARGTALVDALQAARAAADRTTFDLDALAFELAFEEPDAIVALVRERIAYEAYAGTLRGAEGTLVSGAGNALDQALLLARLLRDAAYDVRIASGRLAVADAERLVGTMRPAAAAPIDRPATDVAALEAALGASEEALAAVADQARAGLADLRDESAAAATDLVARLAAADLWGTGSERADLVEEARAYHWVEFSIDGANWTPAHVAFDEGAEVRVEPDVYLTREVPADLQHRFRFQVWIEQRLGEELVAKPITEAWERPVANLFGEAFAYANVPDGMASDEVGALGDPERAFDLDEALARTTFFIPSFQGALAPGAQSFDLDGNSVASADATNPAAAVFREVGGAFGRAAGALTGEADPDAFVALTAQWIEYTLVAPGGAETGHRRTVVDRIGADRRAAGHVDPDPTISEAEVARALATTHVFMVAPGRFGDAYVLDRNVAATLAAAPYADDLLDGLEAGGGALPGAIEAYAAAARAIDHLNLFAAFDLAVPADVLAYRAEPSLVVVERPWDGARARVDVVNNRRRVLRVAADAPPRADPRAALDLGVWETRVEGLPIARGAVVRDGAFAAFAAAAAAGVPIEVLAPGSAEAVAELDLPQDARAAIVADLDAGYAVVVAAQSAKGRLPAWWRVDPASGETLGRGGDGRGVELAEYEAELAISGTLLKAGLVLSGVRAVAFCLGKGSGLAIACCVYENLLIAAGFLVIGGIIAANFAVAAIVLFVVSDLAIQTGVAVAGLMNVLPSICSSAALPRRLTLARRQGRFRARRAGRWPMASSSPAV